jgi:Type IV secretion system pilin
MKKILLLASMLLAPVLFAATASPAPANALFEASKTQACDGANLAESGGDCSDGASAVETTLQTGINILTVIVGIAAVIMIIVNGLKFITANGDSGSISNARNGVIYAIIGLVIVGIAQAVVRFVVGRL